MLLLYYVDICSSTCPEKCQCSTTTETQENLVDCSGIGLTVIPKDIGQTVSYLDLRNNKITELTVIGLSHLTNLSVLLLDDNEISKIEAYSFKTFQRVKRLSLQRNKLTSIKENAFSGIKGWLPCLHVGNNNCELDVSENDIEFIESNAFSWITNLSINIGKTGRATIIKPYSFYGTSKVNRILINDIPHLKLTKYWASETDDINLLHIQHCGLHTIEAFILEGLRDIKEIKFENCSIDLMSEYAFSGVKFLQSVGNVDEGYTVTSSTNKLLGEQQMFSNYKMPYGKIAKKGCGGTLSFSNCDMSNIATDMLRDTNVQRLELVGNRLFNIDPDAFRGLDCLEILSVRDNSIINGLSERSFSSIKHIEEISFENNQLNEVHSYAFKDTHNVGRLTFHLKSNTELRFQSNSLTGLMDIYILEISGNHHDQTNLTLDTNAFYGVVDVNNITISSVNIPQCTKHSFYGMGKVHSLNFIDSKIHQLTSDVFESIPVQTPIDIFTITGEDTGVVCDCETLQHASKFDHMFQKHKIMCESPGLLGEQEPQVVSVELYERRGCLDVQSLSVGHSLTFSIASLMCSVTLSILSIVLLIC